MVKKFTIEFLQGAGDGTRNEYEPFFGSAITGMPPIAG
jgi:hypothetical protein